MQKTIKIDNKPIVCHVADDGSISFEKQISQFFKLNTENNDIYSLEEVIDNLRPRILKELAFEGLTHRVETADNNPKERVLSDFDKTMLKALSYNPRKK